MNLNLENDEGILIQSKNISFYGEDDNLSEVQEIILTNKHLVCIVDKGWFKTDIVIEKTPLSKIKIVEGKAQIIEYSDSLFNEPAFQILYQDGKRIQYIFDRAAKNEISIWINHINQAVTDKNEPVVNSFQHSISDEYSLETHNTANSIEKNIYGSNFCNNFGTKVGSVDVGEPDNSYNEKHLKDTGQQIEDEQMAEQRTVFEGKIHKCPNCGEVIPSFATKCPACDYELRGIKSSESAKEFATRLSQLNDSKQIINLVRAFPIPNSKEDIFEFMVLAASNFDTISNINSNDENREISDAWLTKFEQSYSKAQLLFQKDPDFLKIEDLYNHTEKKIKKARKNHNKQKAGSIVALNIGFLLSVLSIIITFFVDSAGENSSLIQLVGGILLIISSCIIGRTGLTFINLGVGILSCICSILLAGILDNGSFYQLSGGISLIIIAIVFFKNIGKKK